MRLLNSVCKVIADAYPNVPIYVKEVPKKFKRPSFFVTISTDPREIKNRNVYGVRPTFQIIYFGERDEANQVLAEPLYEADSKLEELFLLSLAVPIIPKNEAEKKKRRYAKIESYTSQLRLDEGALYCNLTLNFTDDIPKHEQYDLIEDIDMSIYREYEKED